MSLTKCAYRPKSAQAADPGLGLRQFRDYLGTLRRSITSLFTQDLIPGGARVDDHREDFAHDALLVDEVGGGAVEGGNSLTFEIGHDRELAFEALGVARSGDA